MATFEGVLTALVTPFREGALDDSALRDLVELQIAGGVAGLVPCGTTGESVALTEAEHDRVVHIVVEQTRGRVPVVAGAGSNSTRHTIELARIARERRADGLLLVCPYYNRPTQAGLEAHFRAVLREVPLPSMLYNIPSRTGVDLGLETLERLSDLRAIVAVKEATGNVVRAQQILAYCGDRFDVLSGDDLLTLAMVALGGTGVVSVASNAIPDEVSAVVAAARAADLATARAKHLGLVPFYESLFLESNPGPIKSALARRGVIAEEIRGPLVWPSEATQEAVAAALTRAQLAS